MDSTWWAVALAKKLRATNRYRWISAIGPSCCGATSKGMRAPWRTDARTGALLCLSAAFARKAGFSAAITAGATMARPAVSWRFRTSRTNSASRPVYRAERFACTKRGFRARIAECECECRRTLAGARSGRCRASSMSRSITSAIWRRCSMIPACCSRYSASTSPPISWPSCTSKNGQLVMERSCQWKLPHWPAAFSSDYPLNLISSTDPGERRNRASCSMIATSESYCRCDSRRSRPPAGSPPFVGAPLWAPACRNLARPLARLVRADPRCIPPSTAAALRKLKPTVSVVFEELRRRFISHP